MEGKTENNCLSFRTKWDTEIITVVEKKKTKKKKQANKTSSFTSNLCGIPGVNVWNPKLMGSQVSTKNSGNKEGRSMHVEGEMLYVHVK